MFYLHYCFYLLKELTQSIQEKKATTKRAAQSIDETPNKKRKINIPSRRRPIYTVKTMTSSHLGEMYKKLIEKKNGTGTKLTNRT